MCLLPLELNACSDLLEEPGANLGFAPQLAVHVALPKCWFYFPGRAFHFSTGSGLVALAVWVFPRNLPCLPAGLIECPPWVDSSRVSDPLRGRPVEAEAMRRVLSPSLSRADLWIVSLWSVNHLSPDFIITTNCAVVLTIWSAEPCFWPVVLHDLHCCACVCNHAFLSLCPLTSGLCAPCSLPASGVLWSRSLCCKSIWDTFITLCACMLSCFSQSCPTLCDPMDYSLPGSSIHGILQARLLEWVAISFSRGSSRPRNGACVSCIAGSLFICWAIRKSPHR